MPDGRDGPPGRPLWLGIDPRGASSGHALPDDGRWARRALGGNFGQDQQDLLDGFDRKALIYGLIWLLFLLLAQRRRDAEEESGFWN